MIFDSERVTVFEFLKMKTCSRKLNFGRCVEAFLLAGFILNYVTKKPAIKLGIPKFQKNWLWVNNIATSYSGLLQMVHPILLEINHFYFPGGGRIAVICCWALCSRRWGWRGSQSMHMQLFHCSDWSLSLALRGNWCFWVPSPFGARLDRLWILIHNHLCVSQAVAFSALLYQLQDFYLLTSRNLLQCSVDMSPFSPILSDVYTF